MQRPTSFKTPVHEVLWNAGDGFFPEPVKNVLYKTWYVNYPIELNGWSFVHMGFGAAFRLFGERVGVQPSLLNLVLVHTGWEAFQLAIGMTKPDLAGVVDIAFDTGFSMAGWWLADRFIV